VKNLKWRAAIVIVLILLAFLYLTPSLSKDLPGWWSSFLPQEKIHLGLDLQGGVHLILEVEVNKAIESQLERTVDDLRQDLRKNKIRYVDIKRTGIQGVELTCMSEQNPKEIEKLVETNYPDYKLEPGKVSEKGIAFRMILNPRVIS
jgi:preprotein translocase subunit SecD